MGTANAEEARPPSVQETANISSECLVTDKAVQLLPDFLSLLLWKFFCSPRTSQLFLVKHVTITGKSSLGKTIFSLIFKYVIYIIRFLTQLTSSSGIQ